MRFLNTATRLQKVDSSKETPGILPKLRLVRVSLEAWAWLYLVAYLQVAILLTLQKYHLETGSLYFCISLYGVPFYESRDGCKMIIGFKLDLFVFTGKPDPGQDQKEADEQDDVSPAADHSDRWTSRWTSNCSSSAAAGGWSPSDDSAITRRSQPSSEPPV